MLTHLTIRNFALIDRLDVALESGFTVVTGETGAGKSIVFDALSLLIGGRASADFIRAGEDEASVQGLFVLDDDVREEVDQTLDDAGIATGPELVVRRTLTRTGTNRVFVNDTLATVSLLGRVLAPLVELVGQHEHLTLSRPDAHRAAIDDFGGLEADATEFGVAYEAWQEALAERERLEDARTARAERLDYLRFQAVELRGLELREGEYDELEQRLVRARDRGRLQVSSRAAADALYEGEGSAIERIGTASDALARVSDSELRALGERVADLSALVDDLGRELARYSEALEDEEPDVDVLETRHEALRRAFRKYGLDEGGLLARLEETESEVETLADFDAVLEKASRSEEEALETVHGLAARLDGARASAADRLFAAVGDLLDRLGMDHARLVLARPEGDRKITRWGYDGLEIRFSANPGEPPGPIGRIASGGELSRLMLAFKTAGADSDRLQTYTFDEVDAGIGGGVAEVVGRLLAGLSSGRQVICVTHLPQIACFAAHHHRVEKYVRDGRTFSRMEELDGAEREREVGRMLGGVTLNDATLAHARHMLESARGDA